MSGNKKVNKIFSSLFRPGSLLLEILVVIGIFAIVGPLVAQMVSTSLNSNKWSIDNTVALGLVDETIKAVESVSFESWQLIYDQNKTSADYYYATSTAGTWSIVSTGAGETINVNGRSYTRYFTISNVCRDDTTQEIITAVGVPPCVEGNSDDPSTQKISVTVAWTGGTITKNTYLTRWRNQVCAQTNWNAPVPGSGPVACPVTIFDSETGIDITTAPGSLQLESN